MSTIGRAVIIHTDRWGGHREKTLGFLKEFSDKKEMLPNKKPKKSKLKEKSKMEMKVTKDKIMKKKKKSNLAVLELIKNKPDGFSSVVDDTMIKMNNVDPKVLAKKNKTCKLKSKVTGNEEEREVNANNHGNTDMNEIDRDNLDRGEKKLDKENKSRAGLKKKRSSKKEKAHVNKDDNVHDNLDRGNEKLDKEKKRKVGIKKRSSKKENVMLASGEDQIHVIEDDNGDENNMHAHTHRDVGARLKKKRKEKKEKKAKKMKCKKEDKDEMQIVEAHSIAGEAEVDEISLVDEDCSRGMKKWLAQYKEKRPGLNILQQRIDDYIASYEERLEQERKEREAKLDEEGWTIVKHHKGRKKTTDAESGVSVGSVAQAALVDKLSQKKSKEAPLNFYRHQRRDENRNEIMKLQSKFEEDKRRVQEMRAARKFRPY